MWVINNGTDIRQRAYEKRCRSSHSFIFGSVKVLPFTSYHHIKTENISKNDESQTVKAQIEWCVSERGNQMENCEALQKLLKESKFFEQCEQYNNSSKTKQNFTKTAYVWSFTLI